MLPITKTLSQLGASKYWWLHCNKQMQLWYHIPSLLDNLVAVVF